MNTEQIQERLEKLQAEKTQLQATLVAYEGAIQECNFWLKQSEQVAPTQDSEPTVSE